MCSVARTQRFCRLKAIGNEVATCFPAKNPSVALVRCILHKYKIKCYKRKRKPFINLKQRCYCVTGQLTSGKMFFPMNADLD